MARSDLLVSLVKAGTTGDKRGFQTLAANGSSVLIVAGKKRSPAKPWANAGPQAVAGPSCHGRRRQVRLNPCPFPVRRIACITPAITGIIPASVGPPYHLILLLKLPTLHK
jgi:hypothetical protein